MMGMEKAILNALGITPEDLGSMVSMVQTVGSRLEAIELQQAETLEILRSIGHGGRTSNSGEPG